MSNWGGFRPGAGRKQETVKLSIEDLAEAIYLAHFGHLDDKAFHATKSGEIADWLRDGDLDGRPVLADLVQEWAEYDAEDVARQARQ